VAIYHFNAKVIGRSGGRSATSAAAYRAGARIRDARTGVVFDYTRRRHVAWRAIAAPEDAAAWVWDREQLWNAAEQAETRRDAQIAREVEVALPLELNHEARLRLIAEFVENEFVDRKIVADICVHDNPGNPHCHILLSMRELRPEGFGKKVRAWNDRALLVAWREAWAQHCNRALKRAGVGQRIDHRSLVAQGIVNRIATRHEGVHRRARLRRALVRTRGINNNNRQGERKMDTNEKQQSNSKPNETETADKKITPPSGGIAPLDQRQGKAAKDEVGRAEYQHRVAQHFGDRIYGVQYYGDFNSLHVRIKGGSLRDFGDRVVPKFGGTTTETKAMVEMARMKGWDKIAVAGGESCRRGLWQAAIAIGYSPESIVGYEPTAEDLDVVPQDEGKKGGGEKIDCVPCATPQARRPKRRP
jgi:hypothetical protein